MAIAERDLIAGLMVGLDADPRDAVRRWMRRPEWMAAGACRGVDRNLFFPAVGVSTKAAKNMCAECPVIDDCLAYALADPELEGVWGGTSYRQRRAMRPPEVSARARREKRTTGPRVRQPLPEPPPAPRRRKPKTPKWCSTCSMNPAVVKGRCRTCDAYFRRNGTERPDAERRQAEMNRRRLDESFELAALAEAVGSPFGSPSRH